MSKSISVLVVDDHKILREKLVGLLHTESGIEVVGEAANGLQAIALAGKIEPAVIIMDVNMPGMSGIEATRTILSRGREVKAIGFSMRVDHNVATAMREAGAVAHLAKGVPPEDLIAAIRACTLSITSGERTV